MASAVKPALSNDWLTIDKTANSGSGTVPQINPGSDIPAPVVPTNPPAIPADQFVAAPDSDDFVYSNDPWAFGSDYPSFTQGDGIRGPVPTPEGNVSGVPDPYANVLARPVSTVRTVLNRYAGYDRHSQDTDNAGWQQNTPSGRTSTRTFLGSSEVGYQSFWYQTAERPTPKRFARTAVPNNSPAGTPGVLNGAELPNYADTVYGGPGDIAYSTPAPPPTQQPSSSAGSGVYDGWGF
jgi:hypothetical protein